MLTISQRKLSRCLLSPTAQRATTTVYKQMLKNRRKLKIWMRTRPRQRAGDFKMKTVFMTAKMKSMKENVSDSLNHPGVDDSAVARTSAAGAREVSYEEVLKAIQEGTNKYEVAVLPVTQTAKSRFVPKSGDRRVQVFNAPADGLKVLIGRTSRHESEGGSIDGRQIKVALGEAMFNHPHRTQITVVLLNGLTLVGYIVKSKVRQGLYFPKSLIPSEIKLPEFGSQLPVKVLSLIVG